MCLPPALSPVTFTTSPSQRRIKAAELSSLGLELPPTHSKREFEMAYPTVGSGSERSRRDAQRLLASRCPTESRRGHEMRILRPRYPGTPAPAALRQEVRRTAPGSGSAASVGASTVLTAGLKASAGCVDSEEVTAWSSQARARSCVNLTGANQRRFGLGTGYHLRSMSGLRAFDGAPVLPEGGGPKIGKPHRRARHSAQPARRAASAGFAVFGEGVARVSAPPASSTPGAVRRSETTGRIAAHPTVPRPFSARPRQIALPYRIDWVGNPPGECDAPTC